MLKHTLPKNRSAHVTQTRKKARAFVNYMMQNGNMSFHQYNTDLEPYYWFSLLEDVMRSLFQTHAKPSDSIYLYATAAIVIVLNEHRLRYDCTIEDEIRARLRDEIDLIKNNPSCVSLSPYMGDGKSNDMTHSEIVFSSCTRAHQTPSKSL